VIKTLRAELGRQGPSLVLTGEIARFIARHHAFEESEMGSDLLGEPLIARGAQIKIAAAGALLFQKVDQACVVGEERYIDSDARCYLSLQIAFAVHQPCDAVKHIQWITFDQRNER